MLFTSSNFLVCLLFTHFLNFAPALMARVTYSQEVVRRAQQMIEEGALKEKPGQEVDKTAKASPKWNLGDLEFEAYMRMLDSAVSFPAWTFRFL